jgi:hypothetical protein
MFFADPIDAFRNIRSAMKPSGRLLLTVFRPGPENPWATAVVAAIRHLVPPPPILGQLDVAMGQNTAIVVEHLGRITGYATGGAYRIIRGV